MPTAQLLQYSGAKSPSRELSPNQATALVHMLERLSRPAPSPVTTLGPGGASVTWQQGEGPWVGMLVREGVVTLYRRDASQPEYRVDDVGIEGFLMHCFAELRREGPGLARER